MDIKVPHSQGTEDSFFGLEPVLRGLEPGYEIWNCNTSFLFGIYQNNPMLYKIRGVLVIFAWAILLNTQPVGGYFGGSPTISYNDMIIHN